MVEASAGNELSILEVKFMAKGATTAKRKSKDGVNKAALIREALEKLGIDAPAKAVQEYATAQGASVAAAQISNIRTKIKEGGSKKRGRKAKKAPSSNGDAAVTAGDLIQARIMADKVGGVERAKVLLDLLNKLR
jgi:hypothetical protein